jgi:MFS family permease
VYQVENTGQVLRLARRALRFKRGRPGVSRNVVYIGLTSFFTDVSTEMVTTTLPLYLVFTLRLAPFQFGLIDGLYQGAAVLVRFASGLIADRRRNHKQVAAFGYAVSAMCKPGFLLAQGAWPVLAGVVFLDRVGKGIRTAPRDALISLSAGRDQLATAFGVHRALDTAGAMLGPLIAVVLLALTANSFDAIFVVSFCTALIGLAVVVLLVENKATQRDTDTLPPPISLGQAFRLPVSTPGFGFLLVAGMLLSLATISDAFLYLGLQRRLQMSASLFPLLYVGTALAYTVLAIPFGRLADRFGRGRIFVLGYACLAVVYAALLIPEATALPVVLILVVFGAYYAATDGVLAALASAVLPAHARASGLSLVATATSLARLFASILFGLAWTLWDVQVAVLLFLLALAVAVAVTAVGLLRIGVHVEVQEG